MIPSSNPLEVGNVLPFPTETKAIDSPAVPITVKSGKATKATPSPPKADPFDAEFDLEAGAEPALAFRLICLNDVVEKPTEWLWPNRIVLGNVTILAGDPDMGKSTVSMDMAATVSTGRPWPDSPDKPNVAGSVIIFSAEDSLTQTIKPRLMAAGANLLKIHTLDTERVADGSLAPFELKTGLPILERLIQEVGLDFRTSSYSCELVQQPFDAFR